MHQTEQEIEAEQYIRALLIDNGLKSNDMGNWQVSFLTGLYNGLLMSSHLVETGFGTDGCKKSARIISTYINFRKRQLNEITEINKII